MEKVLKTPPKPKVPIQTQLTPDEPGSSCNTPTTTPPSLNSGGELRKPVSVTPDRLRVPKAFKYPERYTSPTDSLISPVTKGLLARGKKGGAAALSLPPASNQQKIPETCMQDVSRPIQNRIPMLIDEKLIK